jgi:hypothetical protein
LGDLCMYTRIILKLILEIKSGPFWTGSE